MNLGSKIGFNKSSLLSLKAELARKHEEASHAKAHSRTKPSKPLAKPPKTANVKTAVTEDTGNDESADDPTDSNKLDSYRVALEAKAKLYEKLSENAGNETEGTSYLVDFSKKSETTSKEAVSKDEDEDERRVETDSDDYEAPSDPEDDWVDYTDCLGRTRRCLRRDLPDLKAQDAQLYESTKREPSPPPAAVTDDGKAQNAQNAQRSAAPDPAGDDLRRIEQRKKWEKEEDRIRDKQDVHYQDVLFNEARQHGVGYFAFSTDDAERRAQQAALKTLRTETEKQQAATNAARQRRAELLNKRLRAAHNRKRAREGLPPLADDEELPQTERPESPPPEPEPPQVHLAADPEKRGQRPRPAPSVRPWDIGKEGVTQRPVMTQEEWVSKKRKERHGEFAPPSFYEDRNPSKDFKYNPDNGHSKRSKRKNHFREETRRKPMEEVEDFTEEEEAPRFKEKKEKSSSRRGVEIPPPPTMEYFGPGDKTVEASRRRGVAAGTSRITEAELESSISAGLSFLRQQQEEKEKLREKGMLDIL